MARNKEVPDEFPVLKLQGLKATAIVGDGNCLFNALSDQIYGHQDNNREIRQRVVQEMRDHSEDYKPFLDVSPSGGHRRNPKRKNTAVTTAAPTQAEIDRNFENYLSRMANDGTYGDNYEITAFTKAYSTDVVVFSHSGVNYVVTAPESNGETPRAYIALHNFEHYSSVRKIDGPSKGLPQIENFDLGGGVNPDLSRTTVIHDWMVKTVLTSIPTLADEQVIRDILMQKHGNINETVSYLLDQQYSTHPSSPGSFRSSSGGSSIGRDDDSDDELIYGPNKRQNRDSRTSNESEKEKVDVIPTIELTQPDVEMTNDAPVEVVQPAPYRPSIHNLMHYEGSVGASDADDEFRPDESASEYDASSRSPSVDPANPRPRARIILHNKRYKDFKSGHISGSNIGYQSSQPVQNSQQKQPKFNPKPHITARQRKADKKAAQKKASTDRKRAEAQGGIKQTSQLNTSTTSNVKSVSPPMESVLQLGRLNMVKA